MKNKTQPHWALNVRKGNFTSCKLKFDFRDR